MLTKTRNNSTLQGIWRTWPLLLIVVILGLVYQYEAAPNTTARLIVYKLLIGTLAAMLGHIVTKSLYPYMNLRKLLNDMPDATDELAHSVKFAGACLLRAAVMGALIIGCMLGI